MSISYKPYKNINHNVCLFEGYAAGKVSVNTANGNSHIVIHYDNGDTDVLDSFKRIWTARGERWIRLCDTREYPREYKRGERIHAAIDTFFSKVELKRKAIINSHYDDKVKADLLKRLP